MRYDKYLMNEAYKVGAKVEYNKKPATVIKVWDMEKAGNVDTVFDIKLKDGKVVKGLDSHKLTKV